MAGLSKVKGSGLATGAATASLVGIDDNATSTAITIDASENVGIGNNSPSNNHANANNLVVGNGTAGGIANYVGTGLGWYAFSRDNANNSDAFDGGISYDGSRNLMFHTNAGSERMRIDSSGNVNVKTGNLVIGTSGKGIDFSAATPDGTGSTGSEVLDDYEEGDFTPTLISGGDATLSTSLAKYTKIGNRVFITIYVSLVKNSSTSVLEMSGLPFTNIGNSWGSGLVNTSSALNIGARAKSSTATMDFKNPAGDGSTYINNFASSAHLVFQLQYPTA